MKNVYILMIIQALLTLLLFFSEGYVKYTTIGLFLLIDLILFASLLTKKWSVEELLIFAAIFCSGVFMLFYVFMQSTLTIVFGCALMLLFLVIAMIDFISRPLSSTNQTYGNKFDRLQMPEAPSYYYDTEYDLSDASRVRTRPEPVMHVKPEVKPSEVKSKLTAKAVAYELEREATQLKNAEKLMKDLQIYNAEKELLKETKAMQDAQKQMDIVNATLKKAQAAKELKKEAAEIMKVQKQIDEINKINALEKEAKSIRSAERQIKQITDVKKIKQKQVTDSQRIKELEKEANTLKKADKQVKEIQFLNQQERIVKQAKAIAKAQKEIDTMNKDTKKSIAKQVSKSSTKSTAKPVKVKEIVRVRTVKAKEESFYFATEGGNKFHEPGCLAIKKVPKNKLILYTNKKDAMKKGLQPCSVCIPK